MNRPLLISLLLMIAGGRWLSQLWIFGIPLGDLCFWFGILATIFQNRARVATRNLHLSSLVLNFFKLYSIFVILRIIFTLTYPTEFYDGMFLVFRDSAPFLAIGMVGFLATRLQLANFQVQCQQRSYLLAASVLAVLFNLISLYATGGEGFMIAPSLFHLPLLSVRSDQIPISLIPLVFFLMIRSATNSKFPLLILFFLYAAILYKTSSRSTLLAMLLIFLMSINYIFQGTYRRQARSIFLLFFAGAIASLFFAGAKINAFNKLVSGLGYVELVNGVSDIQVSGVNTQQARIRAWQLIKDKFSLDNFFGFPPGDNYILRSGASNYLSGSDLVRSPHNFFVNIFARNGIFIGVFLTLSIFIMIYFSILNLISNPSNLLDWIAATFLMTVLLVSSIGVVLESPFGYIPFTIFASYILARRRLFEDISNHNP